MKFLPDDPRVHYIKMPLHKDRIREYLRLTPGLESVVAFNGHYWDFDAIITVRAGLSQTIKQLMLSPRGTQHPWMKKLWVLDVFPWMTFKKTVPAYTPDIQNRFTLNGYLASDAALICSYHEDQGILGTARKFLPPSQVRELRGKLRPYMPASFTEFTLKKDEHKFEKGGDKPFCVTYVGRMEVANGVPMIKDLMDKAWIMDADNVELLACTQSRITKFFNKEIADVKQASRDEFWNLARTRMDVMLQASIEGGVTMSILEPAMLGVPIITTPSDHVVGMFGPDYPFYAKGPTQMYAWLKAFYDDYDTLYAQFQDWFENWMVPTYKERCEKDLLQHQVLGLIEDFEATTIPKFKEKGGVKAGSSILEALWGKLQEKGEIVVYDEIHTLQEEGVFDDLARKADDEFRDTHGLVWGTDWPAIRLALIANYGAKDASTKTGHLKV